MQHRTVAHLDLDTFFVSVERKKDSSLFGKPVIIGGSSDRGVVASCSYEARQYGVHSAMPMALARKLCPQAIYVRGDMDAYSKESSIVTEILESAAPVVEKASIDEHYLDLTGIDTYVKQSVLFTRELSQRIRNETGLPISFGLSINKTVSKVATGEAKGSGGEKCVTFGEEKPFLAPLSIRKIPMIGEKTYTLLRNLGIAKVETIQAMPVEAMEAALGANGQTIWKKANGIDNSPVEQYSEQKSMSTETTLDRDTTDIDRLRRILITQVDQLAFDLRSQKKVAGCVTLKLRYSDFQTHTFQCRIPYTAADDTLIEKVLELFRKNYSRRVLVRLIGVKFSHLVSGFSQINLFADTEEKIRLYQTLDRIRKRYGKSAIMRGASIDLDAA